MSIYLNNRDNTSKCARYKTLVSFIYILGKEILLENGNIILLAQLDDFPSGDPIQTIFPRGGPHLPVFNHEEVGGITGRDIAVDIQHERFIHSCFVGLDAGCYAVEFAEAVNLWIL
jgi:hypothetical protein